MGIQFDLNSIGYKMKVIFALLTVIVAALAQDTHFCPDNWELHKPEGKDTCSCFLFADAYVRVNHADATTLCNARGGWLAQIEGAPEENYWIVDKLIGLLPNKGAPKYSGQEELDGPHWDYQYWIGAKSYTKHNDHNPGEWVWEATNTTVEWFDWAEGEPNDYHRQQCMSYLLYTYFGNPTFQWNDWDCNTVADYICEKPCSMNSTSIA